jgi:hypothetical protein
MVIRVRPGGDLGLIGVALWCQSSDGARKAAISVDPGAKLHGYGLHIKCCAGKFACGLQVMQGGQLVLQRSRVSDCSGAGLVVFGTARLNDCTFIENAFNGVEVRMRLFFLHHPRRSSFLVL